MKIYLEALQDVRNIVSGFKWQNERPTDAQLEYLYGIITNAEICYKCGEAIEFQDRFCKHCGTELNK